MITHLWTLLFSLFCRTFHSLICSKRLSNWNLLVLKLTPSSPFGLHQQKTMEAFEGKKTIQPRHRIEDSLWLELCRSFWSTKVKRYHLTRQRQEMLQSSAVTWRNSSCFVCFCCFCRRRRGRFCTFFFVYIRVAVFIFVF